MRISIFNSVVLGIFIAILFFLGIIIYSSLSIKSREKITSNVNYSLQSVGLKDKIVIVSQVGGLDVKINDQKLLDDEFEQLGFWNKNGIYIPNTQDRITSESLTIIIGEKTDQKSDLASVVEIVDDGGVIYKIYIKSELLQTKNIRLIENEIQQKILSYTYSLTRSGTNIDEINEYIKKFFNKQQRFIEVNFHTSLFLIDVIAQTCSGNITCGYVDYSGRFACSVSGRLDCDLDPCSPSEGECVAQTTCQGDVANLDCVYLTDQNSCQKPGSACGSGLCVKNTNCTWNIGGGGSTPTPAPGSTPAPSPQGGNCSGGNRCYNDWCCVNSLNDCSGACSPGNCHTWTQGAESCNTGGGPGGVDICKDTKQCSGNGSNGLPKSCGPGQVCELRSEGYWECGAASECYSCNIKFQPQVPITYIQTGFSSTLRAVVSKIVSPQGGQPDKVTFVSSNNNYATATSPDTSAPFETTVTGVNPGSITVTANGYVGGINEISCNVNANVYVYDRAVPSWWQARGADIATNGSISSQIPTTCGDGNSCVPRLIVQESSTLGAGLAVYGTTYDFREGPNDSGTVSNKGWLAQSTFATKTYDYAYFSRMAPQTTVWNNLNSGSINSTKLSDGEVKSPDNYYWYKVNGDLTLNGNLVLTGSRKVILFVENGDLTINGNVNIDTLGSGFFMVIVGKDSSGNKGNISINPSVTRVEGIYVTDGRFMTGNGTERLAIVGSLVSWGGVDLQRDLGPLNNQTQPAELFTYKPEIALRYPQSLNNFEINWVEVVP